MSNPKFKVGELVRAIKGPDKGICFYVSYIQWLDGGIRYFSLQPLPHPKGIKNKARWTREEHLKLKVL